MSARRELLVDGVALAVLLGAILWAADRLALMTVVVPVLFVLRTAAWAAFVPRPRRPLSVEVVFLLLCTLLGAANDWNSVVRHGIYAYTVPADLPAFSTIPTWMLLAWGLVLRFVTSLVAWPGLGPATGPRDALRVGLGSRRRRVGTPALVVGVAVLLVIATRQAIYRAYLDPLWSWLPFAVALAVHALVFGWDARDRRLLVLALLVGPALEVLLIQVAGLHWYPLGWLGGVPLWIALWWALAVLVWRDVAPRLLALLERLHAAARRARSSRPTRPTCVAP
jgi:hypothetical protein